MGSDLDGRRSDRMDDTHTQESSLRKGKTHSDFSQRGELGTIIGKQTVVDGDIRVKHSLRIDGRVRGNIHTTDTIVIGKEGEIEGKVQAKHVLLAGRVVGNVVSQGNIFLESSATVQGDIRAAQLVVDEGAVFDGKCSMKGTKEDASKEIKDQ